MADDLQLLREWAAHGAHDAFAGLVERHVDLVYSAALRQVHGAAHRAEDVTQIVFINLARNAAAVSQRGSIIGWLYVATHHAAANLKRAEARRQAREREAQTMQEILSETSSSATAQWERVRPVLDDAMLTLAERHREALLLRFFKNQSFAQIGQAMNRSEDAARMCVDRALEKLRAALARRGVKSTGAALAAVFANQVGATAPVGLAASITGAALAGATASGVATASLGIFMSKTTVALSAVVIAAIGSAIYQWNHTRRVETELAGLTSDRDSLRAQLAAERLRTARATQDSVVPRSESESSKAANSAAVKSAQPQNDAAAIKKAILNNLRQIASARDEFQLMYGRSPSIDEIVGEGKAIRKLTSVNGESYAAVAMIPGQPLVVTTGDGAAITYRGDETLTPAEAAAVKVGPASKLAMDAYRAAHNGQPPPNPEALVPYFATPQEGADFVEFLEGRKAGRGK